MKLTSSNVVLVVEDDEPKQRSVVQFLQEVLPVGVEIVTAGALSSAIKILSEQEVLLAIVDMSLPTFDFATDRAGGGQPQGFGGADILRFIESETTRTFCVALTQYEEFTLTRDGVRRDLVGLDSVLRAELGDRFFGVIHYSGQYGEWRSQLATVLDKSGLKGVS